VLDGIGVKQMARRSDCPIALTLDLLGDKWTLLILRDVLVFDRHTFSEFANSPERIPTNLLAERLKRLVDAGLLEKVAYQDNPPRFRYLPTAKGRAARPVLRALKQFGEANLEAAEGSIR
jgi:DNA-binding HxlR family transcriptional regulator